MKRAASILSLALLLGVFSLCASAGAAELPPLYVPRLLLGPGPGGPAMTTYPYLRLSGGTMAGNLDMGNNLVLNIGASGTDFTSGGGLVLAGQLSLAAGTANEPSLVWTADDDGTGTGIYRCAADEVCFGSNGAARAMVHSGGMRAISDHYFTMGTTTNNSTEAVGWNTTQTIDSAMWRLGTTARRILFVENGDQGTNFGHPQATHQTLTLQSSDATVVTQNRSYTVGGTYGELFKTLAEGAATSVVQIPVAAEAGTSGLFIYTVYATDGATPQTRSGRILFAVVNDGGTETCVLGTVEELDNTPTGTLTATVTCSTSPTNAVDLQVNATSSLTQTTLQAYYYVDVAGPGEPLPQ